MIKNETYNSAVPRLRCGHGSERGNDLLALRHGVQDGKVIA